MHAPSGGLPPSTNDFVQERRGLLSFEELAFKMSYPVKVHFLALFVTDVRRVASRQSLSLFLSFAVRCVLRSARREQTRERERETDNNHRVPARSFVRCLLVCSVLLYLSLFLSLVLFHSVVSVCACIDLSLS